MAKLSNITKLTIEINNILLNEPDTDYVYDALYLLKNSKLKLSEEYIATQELKIIKFSSKETNDGYNSAWNLASLFDLHPETMIYILDCHNTYELFLNSKSFCNKAMSTISKVNIAKLITYLAKTNY